MQLGIYQRTVIIKAFIAMVFCVCSFQCIAQDIYEVNYKAGPIIKVINPKTSIESDNVRIPEDGNEVGYQFGGFLRLQVNNVYFQPELLFSTIQSRVEFLNYQGISGFNPAADFEFNTLELPMAIGVNIGNFRIDGGPGFSVLLKGSEIFLQEDSDVTEEYNNISLLWRLGAGIDINKVSLDFKYEFGLSKTAESLERIIGRDSLPRQSQLVFSVAYSLVKD
jgi:hypothetical protein